MEEVEEVEYPRLLEVLESDLSVTNAIAAIRAAHPAFRDMNSMHLENSLAGQPDRTRWPDAIGGLAARYAGADLPRPNQTLINWLNGKPIGKNAPPNPVGGRLKLDF